MSHREIDWEVALIEGWRATPFGRWEHAEWGTLHQNCPPQYTTSWHWCGPLVEKYRIELRYDVSQGIWWALGPTGISQEDIDVKRAICLVIADSHYAGAHECEAGGEQAALGETTSLTDAYAEPLSKIAMLRSRFAESC